MAALAPQPRGGRALHVAGWCMAAALCGASAPASVAGQGHWPALVDRDFSVGAGATLIATLGAAVGRAEDAVVPDRLVRGDGVAPRAANVTFRLLKFAFFDAPQEQWLLVINHELFGHGARLRERFDGPVVYHIDPPAPYGGGGGSTSYVFDREPGWHERLAIDVGGMEASAVAAAVTAERALVDGRLHPRDALRYLGFELDTFLYIFSTDEDGEPHEHDVGGFLADYNAMAASVGTTGLAIDTLRREALLSLANPMLAYAIAGIGRYLWSGTPDVPIPALSFGGVRYLPLVRYRLAPYGTEWSLVSALGGRVPAVQVELRIGRAPRETPWGIAVRGPLASWGRWIVSGSIDVWRQPQLSLSAQEPLTIQARPGTQVRLRATRPMFPVWFATEDAAFLVDVGVKSRGFVPGEPLANGVVLRAGLGLPLGR